MSIVFSEATNKTGLCELIDDACGTNTTSFPLAKKAAKINIALDESLALIFQSGGVFKFDDSNHTHDPVITADLVDGQRDYHFTTDEDSALILDILEVWTKNSATGVFKKLTKVDRTANASATMDDGVNTEGIPTEYSITGNGIILDLIPSYNSTGGLKVIINRQASYFLSTDTTKVAGIDGLCHDFLYLKPAYEYARDKGLANREVLFRDLQIATQKIIDRYKTKERKVINKLTPFVDNGR
jgi:hypothetical protein